MKTFTEWLAVAKVTNDPAGDFVVDAKRDWQLQDKFDGLKQLRSYLQRRKDCVGAIEAADTVWKRYCGWAMK